MEMGAKGRGGVGGFIGGLGRGVDGLNVAIEERFQWHVMAMKARQRLREERDDRWVPPVIEERKTVGCGVCVTCGAGA